MFRSYHDGKNWVRVNDIKISNVFMKGLRIVKSRAKFYCSGCGKDFSKGNRYIGYHYEKVCQGCIVEWVDNASKSFKDILKTISGFKKEVTKNKDKWNREVLLEKF